MCQLFGISVSDPIRLRFGWEEFARRGSEDGGNPDGWGVAYFDDREVLLLREPRPAADSPLVRFLARDAVASNFIISHLRRATEGDLTLQNTQPFVRYMAKRAHAFAHNGHVPDIRLPSVNSCMLPVGDTDSERLFAVLLSRLEPLWKSAVTPALKDRLGVVEEVAAVARDSGAANFIYCDGVTMFVHGHRHTMPGQAVSTDPGLYVLERQGSGSEFEAPCKGIGCDDNIGRQCVAATIPLDDQGWVPLGAGEIACVEQGRRIL